MGRRNNNSYADTTISGFRYGDVFTEQTTRNEGISCNSYANCYIGCECNTSKGWYSYCKEDDCHKVTDNHYTGVNSLSAGKNLNLNGQNIFASGVKSGLTVASSGISAMASSATTCYKVKTCEDKGYYSSIPSGKTCKSFSYNGRTCYTNCVTSECTYFSASFTPHQNATSYVDVYLDVSLRKSLSYDVTVTVIGLKGMSSYNSSVTVKAGNTRGHTTTNITCSLNENSNVTVKSISTSPSSAQCD